MYGACMVHTCGFRLDYNDVRRVYATPRTQFELHVENKEGLTITKGPSGQSPLGRLLLYKQRKGQLTPKQEAPKITTSNVTHVS